MKIGLSKKEDGKSRHITLVLTKEENDDVHSIIFNDVLMGEARPVRESFVVDGPNNTKVLKYRYRFHMRYLEDLMLTFPYADFSPGLDKYMNKEVKEIIATLKIPKFKIKNFHGKLHDFQKISVHRTIRLVWPDYPKKGKTKGKGKKLELVNQLGKELHGHYINDEMGLGKTVQVLAVICALRSMSKKSRKGKVLIVVPSSVKHNWRKEIEKFTDLTCAVVHGTQAERRELIKSDADIIIINPEMLRVVRGHMVTRDYGGGVTTIDREDNQIKYPELFEQEWFFTVIDEFHRFKNPEAQQTQGLLLLRSYHKLVMSGTPLLNGRPEEVWSTLHWMWPKKFPDYGMFCNDHMKKKGSKVVAYKGLKKIKKFMYGAGLQDEYARAIRRRKEHVNKDLPAVVETVMEIELSDEQRRLYNQIRDELRIWVEENPKRISNALTQMVRLKQAAFSPELYGGSQHSTKIDQLKLDVAELVASGEKAIIFTQWVEAAEIIARELAQYNPAVVTGKVAVQKGSEKKGNMTTPRQDQVDKFNEDDDCKIFIGTLGACKEGFTLSAGTYVLAMDEDWVPATNIQAYGRSAAGGLRGLNAKVDTVNIIIYRAKDTIEEWIAELLAAKQKMNDRMTEMDSGNKVERITARDIRELLAR